MEDWLRKARVLFALAANRAFFIYGKMNIWLDFTDGIHGVLQPSRHSVSGCCLGEELDKVDRISLLEAYSSATSILVSVFKQVSLQVISVIF